jgi:alkyl hydroperoxide reductase subunit AhpC|tara:strand:+ start:751 stop:936 length:186 start_codon:yes stop_codon:yes gene_type:complete
LSDFYPHGKATQSFGVFNDETGVPKRSVFLIDKKGIVRFSKIYDQAIDLNPSDILAEVNKL